LEKKIQSVTIHIENAEKFIDHHTKANAAMDENLKVLDEQLQQL